MAGIVHGSEPITLVGAGSCNEGDLNACLKLAPRIVAADGGVETCLRHGLVPEAVIGDMDSFGEWDGAKVPADRVHRIAEQDSTDFDKALRNIEAPVVLGVGFTGGRIDHELACYNVLVSRPDRRCVLIGSEDIVFLCPPKLELRLKKGTRVSLFPFSQVQGRSTGLRWPIDGLTLRPDGKIATSNQATGPIALETDAPGLLVILPRDCLEEVVRALVAQSGSWSAL